MGGLRPHGSALRAQGSLRPPVIVSDPVQISQIRYGKSTISQILIVSDPVQISQIRHGKSPLSQPQPALIVPDPAPIGGLRPPVIHPSAKP